MNKFPDGTRRPGIASPTLIFATRGFPCPIDFGGAGIDWGRFQAAERYVLPSTSSFASRNLSFAHAMLYNARVSCCGALRAVLAFKFRFAKPPFRPRLALQRAGFMLRSAARCPRLQVSLRETSVSPAPCFATRGFHAAERCALSSPSSFASRNLESAPWTRAFTPSSETGSCISRR
jgi:hypothetical protein